MAIYKDYGTPPSTNATSKLAGTVSDTLTQGVNVTVLGDGATGQFRGGDALPALAFRQKEAPTYLSLDGSDSLTLGDLDGVLTDTDETEIRIRIESQDQSTDIIELDYNGTTLTINGSATGSVFEAANTPTLATNIAFGVDAAKNLLVSVGASVTDGTKVIVRRVDWS